MHMKASDQNLSVNCLKNTCYVSKFWFDAFICVLYYQNLPVKCLINRVGEFWSDAFICILVSKSVGELSQKSCW